eukprot:scaffold251780_cov31-Tisochrysis_lutea.AAC.1
MGMTLGSNVSVPGHPDTMHQQGWYKSPRSEPTRDPPSRSAAQTPATVAPHARIPECLIEVSHARVQVNQNRVGAVRGVQPNLAKLSQRRTGKREVARARAAVEQRVVRDDCGSKTTPAHGSRYCKGLCEVARFREGIDQRVMRERVRLNATPLHVAVVGCGQLGLVPRAGTGDEGSISHLRRCQSTLNHLAEHFLRCGQVAAVSQDAQQLVNLAHKREHAMCRRATPRRRRP